MDEQWTAEVAEDLQAQARLAAVQPITPAAQLAAFVRQLQEVDGQRPLAPRAWRLLVLS